MRGKNESLYKNYVYKSVYSQKYFFSLQSQQDRECGRRLIRRQFKCDHLIIICFYLL